MKTAVPQVSHRGTLVEQAGICSTCVPPGAGKTRRGGTPAIPCPVSKIGTCSTWAIKKQHTPASARHSPVVALCGLFPGWAGTYPARTAEATSERVAGKAEHPVSVILNEVKNPLFLLHADRDGSGGTEAEVRILRLRCAPLRMTARRSGSVFLPDRNSKTQPSEAGAFWRGEATEHSRRNDSCRRHPAFLSRAECASTTPGQAEPPAVHRLPHDTGRKPGPTSLHEKERRNEKKISDESKNYFTKRGESICLTVRRIANETRRSPSD